MLHEIETGHFEICRQLFEPLAFELITRAVIDGSSPGSIYVDDLTTPRGAFMTSAEGCFIAGAPGHVVFWDGFKAMINNWADRNEVKPDNDAALYLVAHPAGWNKRLADLLPGRPPITVQRRHYVCQELSYDWRTTLPEGFVVQHTSRAGCRATGARRRTSSSGAVSVSVRSRANRSYPGAWQTASAEYGARSASTPPQSSVSAGWRPSQPPRLWNMPSSRG
jgi:hypothetical protein